MTLRWPTPNAAPPSVGPKLVGATSPWQAASAEVPSTQPLPQTPQTGATDTACPRHNVSLMIEQRAEAWLVACASFFLAPA